MKTNNLGNINMKNFKSENEQGSADDLAEYLERLSRTMPTTTPEWMN
jgi:hypothetical protein